MLSEGRAAVVQATGGKKPLAQATGDWAHLVQAVGGQAPLVWAEGSAGLSAMWCLLCDLQEAWTNGGGLLRGRREVWPATTGGQQVGSACSPVTTGVGKKEKKKRALQPRTTHCCSQAHGNTPALQLPLPNTLGGVQMLDHCSFPRPYN